MGCEFNLFVQDMEFCFDQAVSRATEGRFLIGKIINLSLVQAPGLIWFSRVHASINSVPEYKSQLFILLMGHLTLVSSDHLPLRSCSFSNVCFKKKFWIKLQERERVKHSATEWQCERRLWEGNRGLKQIKSWSQFQLDGQSLRSWPFQMLLADLN